jgi:hypothetical protein
MMEMIQLVMRNNPALISQAALLAQSRTIPDPRKGPSVTGISLNVGSQIWDYEAGSFEFGPSVGVGLNFALRNPSRTLTDLTIQKEKAAIEQEYERIKDQLVADLLSRVGDLVQLRDKRRNLAEVRSYLQDYSELIERQVKAGVAQPDPARVLDLRERVMGINVEMRDAEVQIETLRLETAVTLGGEAWEELLGLLRKTADAFPGE